MVKNGCDSLEQVLDDLVKFPEWFLKFRKNIWINASKENFSIK